MNQFKCMVIEILRGIFSFCGNFIKVKSNRITMYSFSGEQYSCSPRYLAEYINDNYNGKFDIIWAIRKNVDSSEIPKKFKVIKYNSLKFFYYYSSSKFIVNNIYPSSFLKTKSNQLMIDTWHGGGAYKRTINVVEENKNHRLKKEQIFYANNITYFVTSSRAFKENFVRHELRYHGETLDYGLPRNDILFGNNREEVILKVKEKLDISVTNKLFLYAPTWRNYSNDDFYFDAAKLKKALNMRFGGEWSILFRMHHFSSIIEASEVIDASNYSDMQELLLASDFMVTDYSSCMWDYILMKKPILLYAYDLEKYHNNPGFYNEIQDWKLPVCQTFDSLIESILKTSDEQFLLNAKLHYDFLGGYEKGNATRCLANFIYKKMRTCDSE